MIPPHKDHPTATGLITVRLLLAMLLGLPALAVTAPAWIPISECELNGFSLGGTVDQMRQALGEPDRSSVAKPPGNDYPNTEYHYDGLRIVFSMFGRSAITFFVTSGDYRLRSGIGLGSSRPEIESTLGPATEIRSDDSLDLVYGLTGPSGRPGFGQLTFKLESGVAVEMIAGWPSR